MVEQRAAGEELHPDVQLSLGLERELQPAEERVVDLLQDLPLAARVLHLLPRQHARLHQDLQRVDLVVPLAPHQQNLPERPLPDDLQQLEVVLRQRRRHLRRRHHPRPSVVHMPEIARPAHAHRLVGPLQHHPVATALPADHAPAQPAVMLPHQERERLHARLALAHVAVRDPVRRRLQIRHRNFLQRARLFRRLRGNRGDPQRLDQVLPEGDGGRGAREPVGGAGNVLRGGAGHLEEEEDALQREQVRERAVGGVAHPRGNAEAAEDLLELLCIRERENEDLEALAGGEGGGDPVDGVLLEELADGPAVAAAQAEVQLRLQRVGGLREGDRAQAAEDLRFARLEEVLRLDPALAVRQDEDVRRRGARDDAVPDVSRGEKEEKRGTERACREFRCEGWNVW